MISIPKGTKDVLPSESFKWQFLESTLKELAKKYNFKEIRTPIFEHTELFLRGVGETTDIVNKEMYTFLDKGERSMTLKPEGTAGVARSFIENSLYAGVLPVKMFYITPVFRYERPQAGRLREHHQFGIELYGSPSPSADAEIISFGYDIFKTLSVKDITVSINNIGCPKCRTVYNSALKTYFKSKIGGMCKSCLERLEKNPLRILDCKEDECREIIKDAPITLDYLCDDCKTHHNELRNMLDNAGIVYKINPKIVRGLDYYTGTVFEFISDNIGAQGTVLGGGRYNNLVSEVGGDACPAVGFGVGLERLIMLLETLGLSPWKITVPDVYIAPVCEGGREMSLSLAKKIRDAGLSVEYDLMERSFKSQMKYADKLGAKFVVILGDDELLKGLAQVKNMADGKSDFVPLTGLCDRLLLLVGK